MDQLAPYYILFFLSIFLPLFIIIIKIKLRSSNQNLRLPPGPWPLPIIGSIHHLIGPHNPHHALRKLSTRFGDLMFLQLGKQPTVIVSSPDAAKEIMKNHDLIFASRKPTTTVKILTFDGQDMAFAPYGEYWRQIRKICIAELLSPKRIQSFRSVREDEVGNLIQSISYSSSNGELVNMSKSIFVMINSTSVRAVVGSKCNEYKDVFLSELQKAFDVGSGLNLVDLFPSSRLVNMISGVGCEARRCNWEFDRLLDRMIQAHRDRKEVQGEVEDLLGVLLRLYDHQDAHELSLSMDTIKAIIFDAFAAGTETSATTLDWVMFELMRNPKMKKKAQLEIRRLLQGRANVTESDLVKLDFLHLIIKETLRLHPPLPLLLPRECRETCHILGYDIPKGTTVIVNAWAIGRDSKYWKDAEEFNPERFLKDNKGIDFQGTNFEFIPFGAGRRMCPGINFGLANIELVLASLLYHFNWELPHGIRPEELESDMEESSGLNARRKSDLLLCAIPYVSS